MTRAVFASYSRPRGNQGKGSVQYDHPVLQPPVIQVSDHLERRIRKPVDALRCVITCFWIFVLAVAAVAASATTTGVETDIVGASKRLPPALLDVVPPIVLFALFILPVGLAVSLLFRRQARRLIEAAATGLVAGAVKPYVPNDAPGWYVAAGFLIYFEINELFVRGLEKNGVFLRL